MSILINLIGFYSFLNNTELVKKYLNILIETLKLSDSINKSNIGRWLGQVLDKSKKQAMKKHSILWLIGLKKKKILLIAMNIC